MIFLRRVGLAVLLYTGSPAAALAWNSPAPDVVLYCTPALDAALHAAAAGYTAQSQVPVHIFIAPPDGLSGLLKHRARADVVVADAATLEMLAAGKLVRAGTAATLGKDPFVLVARASAGSTAPATAEQLVASHSTVIPDATTAASFDGAAVLRASLASGASPTTLGVADTPDVVARVQENGSLLGLVTATEEHGTGLVQAAVLRAEPFVMRGALVVLGQSRNAAALLTFIAGPDGQAILRAQGLEAAP